MLQQPITTTKIQTTPTELDKWWIVSVHLSPCTRQFPRDFILCLSTSQLYSFFFSVAIEPRSPTHLVLNLQSQVFVSSLEVLNSKDICGTSVYFLPHRLPDCFLYAYSKQLFVQGRVLYTKTSFDSVQATPAEMCTTRKQH